MVTIQTKTNEADKIISGKDLSNGYIFCNNL